MFTVVDAVERKNMKVQELILSEEAHLENLEAVERIRNEAKKMKKDKTFPKHLRFTIFLVRSGGSLEVAVSRHVTSCQVRVKVENCSKKFN